MKVILALILTLVAGAQTYNNENWSQQPGGSIQYYFVGNTVIPTTSSAFVDLNLSNAATPIYSTPNGVGMPFVGTMGNLCITLNTADEPYPVVGSNTFTVWHMLGAIWVPTALSVTIPNNPIASAVWCDNNNKISPSSGSDLWAVQLTSTQTSIVNIFTELSVVMSPPQNSTPAVLTQANNLFPSAAPGNALWTVWNIKSLIQQLPDAQFYGVGVWAPSLSGPGILPLYQSAMGKSGTLSGLCYYTTRNNSGSGNDPFAFTVNINSTNTAETVTVPSAAGVGLICDNTHSVKVKSTDLLLIALQDTGFTGNGIQLGSGTYAVVFTINP